MADHYPQPLLRKLQRHVSNSTQLFGLLTLLITGTVLLLLMGLTVVLTIMGLLLFSPLLLLTSPIWGPPCFLMFLVMALFWSFCGFGLVTVAMLSWVYRYFRRHRYSLGWDRVDSASHVKEYEYGYLQSNKVKFAAPGA